VDVAYPQKSPGKAACKRGAIHEEKKNSEQDVEGATTIDEDLMEAHVLDDGIQDERKTP